jgi:hypothetical protein
VTIDVCVEGCSDGELLNKESVVGTESGTNVNNVLKLLGAEGTAVIIVFGGKEFVVRGAPGLSLLETNELEAVFCVESLNDVGLGGVMFSIGGTGVKKTAFVVVVFAGPLTKTYSKKTSIEKVVKNKNTIFIANINKKKKAR